MGDPVVGARYWVEAVPAAEDVNNRPIVNDAKTKRFRALLVALLCHYLEVWKQLLKSERVVAAIFPGDLAQQVSAVQQRLDSLFSERDNFTREFRGEWEADASACIEEWYTKWQNAY